MSRDVAALKKRVGSKIRGRRNSLKMSQEELAFNAQLTPTYVSQIEAGTRNPSLEVLFRLCSALETDLADLFKA